MKSVMKYRAACLLYARVFFDTTLQDIGMYLHKIFIIMNYCTVLQIFLIKTTLLPNISSILCSNHLFNNGEFILRLKYATNIYHSWEDCKIWDRCPITGIPPNIVIYANQEIIITNMNYKFNDYSDTPIKEIGVKKIEGTLTLELIRK